MTIAHITIMVVIQHNNIYLNLLHHYTHAVFVMDLVYNSKAVADLNLWVCSDQVSEYILNILRSCLLQFVYLHQKKRTVCRHLEALSCQSF